MLSPPLRSLSRCPHGSALLACYLTAPLYLWYCDTSTSGYASISSQADRTQAEPRRPGAADHPQLHHAHPATSIHLGGLTMLAVISSGLALSGREKERMNLRK